MALSLALSNSITEAVGIVERHIRTDGDAQTPVPGLVLTRRCTAAEPVYMFQQPTVAFLLQGRKTLRLAHEIYVYEVGECLLVSEELPVLSQVTEASADRPQLGVGILLRQDLIAEISARMETAARRGVPSDLRGVGVASTTEQLFDPVLRLLRLLDSPSDISVLAEPYEKELIFRLLTGSLGDRLLHRAKGDGIAARISKAIEWMRSNFSKPLLIPEHAADIGMSESSFYENFKAVTAMTPIQYRKRLQLQTARQLILVDGLSAGTAGYQVGYQSHSQFSRDYLRFFGHRPLDDTRRNT